MFGIRSVDPAEQAAMQERDIFINDMRVIDERGIVAPLREFLDRVPQRRRDAACQPGRRFP
jgi:arginase